MHHSKTEIARIGDNVGINVKGLEKKCMPKTGDVAILKADSSLKASSSFMAQIQTLDNIPNHLSIGYCPVGYVRCSRSACKIAFILWKVGRETGGRKVECPSNLKSNEMGLLLFLPLTLMVVDTFNKCPGLSRLA